MTSVSKAQALIDLIGGGLPGATVDLRHQKHPLAIAVAQRVTHPDLALAVVVVPAVVHEAHAVVDGGADERYRLIAISPPSPLTRHVHPTDRFLGQELLSAVTLRIRWAVHERNAQRQPGVG